MEFQENLQRLTKEAEDAGLLKEPTKKQWDSDDYAALYDDDPVMALAKLRIEIERRLNQLAKKSGVQFRRRGLAQLSQLLVRQGVLSKSESNVIADLMPLLNAAVHAQGFSVIGSSWAVDVGPKLIAGLDRKLAEVGGSKA